MAELRYKRVLLKISGEALMGSREFGLDPEIVHRIAGEIKAFSRMALGEGIEREQKDFAAEVAAQLGR